MKLINKMMLYESIADDFDSVVNMYDTNRRMDVVFNELLIENLRRKHVLDAGCGTGWFSAGAANRGANVTSMDVGPELLKQVAKKCKSKRVIGSILEMPFKNNSFDFIISSEVIEHVTDQQKAISEIHRVLKPNGILVLTTPNAFWHWSVTFANTFKLRPYQGLENWLGYSELQNKLKQFDFQILHSRGLHAFPFQLSFTHPILEFLDNHASILYPYMVNTCVKAKKN